MRDMKPSTESLRYGIYRIEFRRDLTDIKNYASM